MTDGRNTIFNKRRFEGVSTQEIELGWMYQNRQDPQRRVQML